MDMFDRKLTIYGSMLSDNIDETVGCELLNLYENSNILTEDVFSKGPFNSKNLKKLKDIKDMAPFEYQGPKEIKEYIDKYYDDIVKCSKLMESEQCNIRSNDIKIIIRVLVGFFAIPILGGIMQGVGSAMVGTSVQNINMLIYSGMATGAGLGMNIAVMGVFIATFSSIFVIIISLVYIVIRYIRNTNDNRARSALSKIGDRLRSFKNQNNIPELYKNKIIHALDAISSVEYEVRSKTGSIKEFVTDMKLKIYEAFESGSITKSQRDMLLSKLIDENQCLNMTKDELKLLVYEGIKENIISEYTGNQLLNVLCEESNDITASLSGGSKKFILYGKDRDEIQIQVDKVCKTLYKFSKFKDNIKRQPTFRCIKKNRRAGDLLEIFLGGITDNEFYSGYGITFYGEVSKHLNSVRSLSRYMFQSEDYPGIWVTLRHPE